MLGNDGSFTFNWVRTMQRPPCLPYLRCLCPQKSRAYLAFGITSLRSSHSRLRLNLQHRFGRPVMLDALADHYVDRRAVGGGQLRLLAPRAPALHEHTIPLRSAAALS